MRKLTKEEFVKKAKKVHKDSLNEYFYDKFEYVNAHTKSTIICEKHGDFEQRPSDHLSGYGCPECKKEKLSNLKRSNLEEFIEKSKKVHKDSKYKYSYDKFVYVNNRTKGIITCEKHGDFEQTPNIHLNDSGCPECAIEKNANLKRSNLEEFVKRAKIVHNDSLYKYFYDDFVYVNSNTKGIITCEKHGDFEQTPAKHLRGQGCPNCAIEKSKSNLEEFIEKAKEIHKGSKYKYSYNNFLYIRSDIKGIITCEKHGSFEQSPASHLQGHGCPECWRERQRELQNIKWYNRYSEGVLYLIECWNDVEKFVKIGVTSNTVEERYRNSILMPYQFKVLKEIYTDSNIVSDTEQYIIEVYESYKPKISFGGDTECFCIDEKYQIIEFLENLEKDFKVSDSSS